MGLVLFLDRKVLRSAKPSYFEWISLSNFSFLDLSLVTPLESAVTRTFGTKSFRMCTYRKPQGEGVSYIIFASGTMSATQEDCSQCLLVRDTEAAARPALAP